VRLASSLRFASASTGDAHEKFTIGSSHVD
jgi:hypothetical protein